MAAVLCVLQLTFRNICVRVARTVQPYETKPRRLLLRNDSTQKLCILPNTNAAKLLFCHVGKTNKFVWVMEKNSISLTRCRISRRLFLNNAGTPEKHHKAEEHPAAQTKPVPHCLPLASWSQRGINRPHSQRRRKLDSARFFFKSTEKLGSDGNLFRPLTLSLTFNIYSFIYLFSENCMNHVVI